MLCVYVCIRGEKGRAEKKGERVARRFGVRVG